MKSSRRSFLTKAAAATTLTTMPFATFGNELVQAVDQTSKRSAPSDLQITDIKCGYIRGGHSLFVKIYSNQDIVGHGEGVDATPGTYHLVKMFGERLKGKNPLNVHRLFEDIRRGGFFEGAQSGMYVAVLTAVETALWDLTGKALNLPVYQLLGGKFRDKIRVYMDTALYQNRLPKPEDFAASAKEAVDMGFTAVKFDLDQANDPNKYDKYNWTASPAEIERMHDQMAAAREAVGPNIDICADMHGRYDAITGEKVAKILEPIDMMWLEEPIPAENVDAYKKITDSTSTPICAGENHYLAYGFRRLLETGAVDIIMPDLQKAGGLGEAQRIANLANLYYVPFAPHMVASFLGAMASCHVCASVPNFMILEWQIYFHKNPMYKEIVSYDGEMVEDGFIKLSEKPGIGVEINEEGMKKYADKNVPFFK
ncbi:mandelate racemase/muconate lactonizing enzyme family protein [Euzebyella marina]|uniref:Mandelate racemase/muconate lactonizing enzyme family protein n=1 Tax=Euzebyella marina TaxID=1761453 RepID=A0A3G2L8Y7_9FLAO|nr:mandelate racemase/muconate lactonizing enzyme family protein [Euzebyella marina]AYN68704.1 mandelate racemase/muconate lactonizing enzyme family protein [Euzebyella marina]MAU72214.1 mandelate racemase [Pseudozobellia sp.]MBG49800.1 mandelate racemase [Pseudozobellia sp.]|tara:strand:- start:1536 stop:2813 length:1278 start_codon:yes stop_codon:yes gene_type:complete